MVEILKHKTQERQSREECTQVTKRSDTEEVEEKEEEEDEKELAVGRAMHCNKEKCEQDKDIRAWVEVEIQTQRNKELRYTQH